MDIAIIGLPRSGKTTIFNAITRGAAEVASYGSPQGKPNIGVAKVPDERLDILTGMYNPRRTVPAEVVYVDIPAAPEGLGKTRGISGEFLNHLQRADALLIVSRAFRDESVSHISETVDPFRDIDTMMYELAFSDLEILERRLARIADGFKAARGSERDALTKEQALIERLKAGLEEGIPVRDQSLTSDEKRMLGGFQFLTGKPLILVVNVGEAQIPEISIFEERLESEIVRQGIRTTALCGKLEMELAQMDEADELEFRESLGAGESGLNRMIRLSYDVLELVTFLTVGEDEVRAWPVTKGTAAVNAAGKIHSDLERGFIRAEVVKYTDLVKCGSEAEAKRNGVLRQEGKTYVVKDGDVLHILFNV